MFATDAEETYKRVDRVGMPAVSALVMSTDAYNAADPADDVQDKFIGEIQGSVGFFHSLLDDDLTGAGLAPCVLASCMAEQVNPLVLPDTLKIDLGAAAGFPNGRKPSDPVVDRMLAAELLDWKAPTGCNGKPCSISTLSDLPLNPPANDVPLGDTFPYLAPPHTP
ncbi:MAG: hypothetical protein ABI134_32410 [Byssovorax sp.]